MFLNAFVAIQSFTTTARLRPTSNDGHNNQTDISANDQLERGEGVISSAIAVLIMAVIGAAMYTAYTQLFERTTTAVTASLDQIAQ